MATPNHEPSQSHHVAILAPSIPKRLLYDGVRSVMALGCQRSVDLTLPGFVFGELARDLIEFGTIPQLSQCLFLLGVLLALL